MRTKSKLTLATVFLLLVHTQDLWIGKLGIWAFPAFFSLLIFFFFLSVLLLFTLLDNTKYRFKSSKLNITSFYLSLVLASALIWPFGIPLGFLKGNSFQKLSQESAILVAQWEGAANCHTSFWLEETRFVERTVCFGVQDAAGNYEWRNDTIFFSKVSVTRGAEDYFEYAVIKPSKHGYMDALCRYKNKEDTIGVELWITKNELDQSGITMKN